MCSVALGVAAGLVLMRLRAGASAKKHGPPAMPETESKP
jgi:hypothetical protein